MTINGEFGGPLGMLVLVAGCLIHFSPSAQMPPPVSGSSLPRVDPAGGSDGHIDRHRCRVEVTGAGGPREPWHSEARWWCSCGAGTHEWTAMTREEARAAVDQHRAEAARSDSPSL
jgi:hypothetical protein